MRTLPPSLAPLGAYRQFILYRIAPSATRPGKTDKLPCDWRTGSVVTAHDPQYWTDFETAAGAAARFGDGFGVGFVFTASDPFWFIDSDACWDGAAWSPVAQQLCAMFEGAAVEVSQSGTGLHLFGTGTVPPHGTRLKRLGLEFYTSGRFVALTGLQAIGNAAMDFSDRMSSFVAQWFPPGAEHEADVTWSTEPVPEWRGPTDDDDLIRRALLSASLSAFGGATFADLWQGNVDVLARAYPVDPNSDDAYGASEADSALASHLLFWTGKNHERTRELMKQSALVRAKWDREDYLERTILSAAGVVRGVCQDKPVQAPIVANVAQPLDGRTFIPSTELADAFKGCVYIQDNHAVLMPNGDIVDQGRFNVVYGGMAFCLDAENSKLAKHAWDAFTNNRVTRLPRAHTSCFRPDLPFQEQVEHQGRVQVNVYYPPVIARRRGDPAPFINHIKKLLPNGDDAIILLSYLCAIVQYPGYKFRWAPFLQGVEGNGKGLILEALIRAIGDKYVFMIGPDMITNGFNAWAENNVLLVADDIFREGNRETMMDALRRYITETRHPVTYKGIDATNKKICGNWLFIDNHAELMRITDNTRRICVLYCAQQHEHQLADYGLTPEYFNDYLTPWFKDGGYEIVAEYLHTAAIDPRYNPAEKCQRAPDTSSTALAVSDGKTLVESNLAEWIENGEPGFAGGFISVNMLKKRLDKQPSVVRVRQMLGAIGYVQAGRASRKVHPDEMQPVIYVKAGKTVVDLAGEYEAAQIQGVFK